MEFMHNDEVKYDMSYLKTVHETVISDRYKNGFKRHISFFVCDACNKEYTRSYRKDRCDKTRLTFCSKICQHSEQSGKIQTKRTINSIKKHGCHYTQLDSVKQKMLETRVEKYGSTAPVHYHLETHTKYQTTMLERYGTVDPLPKARKAFLKKYGASSPWALPDVRAKNDLVAAGQKGYRAMALKGRKKLSKPERQLGDWLITKFGNDHVESQFEIKLEGRKSWLIDFYIKSINVYVQLDGVFWHGLDKSLDEIKSFPRVLSQYEDDRVQDDWFCSKDLKLVRITDLEWNACYRAENFDNIVQKLGGY